MATKAYILVETEVGTLRDVAGELRNLTGVETVDPVAGPYDIIAVVNAANLTALGDLVSTQFHAISGIKRTMTCFSIEDS